MPAQTASWLTYATLTRVVNEIRNPLNFLKNTLYSREEPLATETIELAVINGSREIAPFVRRGGEAVMVGGTSETWRNVTAPNVRTKRVFHSTEMVFGRAPGTPIFASQGQIRNGAQQRVVRELTYMADMHTNTEEYMASRMLQGSLSYSEADQEVFSITVPRDASRSFSLSTFWDQASPTPLSDIHSVKELQNTDSQPAPTDCILGTEAAAAFITLTENGTLKLTNRDNSAIIGTVDLTRMFNDAGVLYLGTVGGINFWEYARTATLNGSSVDMIRPKYAEFFNRNNSASVSDRVAYYGAHADAMIEGINGPFVSKRFSNSWVQNDPAGRTYLLASRPLLWPRRPDATVSVKVVSG